MSAIARDTTDTVVPATPDMGVLHMTVMVVLHMPVTVVPVTRVTGDLNTMGMEGPSTVVTEDLNMMAMVGLLTMAMVGLLMQGSEDLAMRGMEDPAIQGTVVPEKVVPQSANKGVVTTRHRVGSQLPVQPYTAVHGHWYLVDI